VFGLSGNDAESVSVSELQEFLKQKPLMEEHIVNLVKDRYRHLYSKTVEGEEVINFLRDYTPKK